MKFLHPLSPKQVISFQSHFAGFEPAKVMFFTFIMSCANNLLGFLVNYNLRLKRVSFLDGCPSAQQLWYPPFGGKHASENHYNQDILPVASSLDKR